MNKDIQPKEKRQLSSLKNNTEFNRCLKKLIVNEELTDDEKELLFSCSIICFKNYNLNNEYKGYFNLAYYIILKYSIHYNDYKPLYDISLQIGFYPISNKIIYERLIEETAIKETIINNAIKNKYQSVEGYIETLEQNKASKEIVNNTVDDIAYIAPTSYGKSSIIKEIIKQQNYNKIGIIVPTKSLLQQTYKDIKKLNLNYKIILHDEMYEPNYTKFIGILTQERASRIINKNNIGFELLFIDEAHKLLSDDFRSIILSRFIQLNKKKYDNQKVIFLSPLVNDTSNLQLININSKIKNQHIKRDMKSFEIFLWENEKISKYNRFTNDYYNIGSEENIFNYIITKAKNKNFIYNNKPICVERIAKKLGENLEEINIEEDIEKIINTLSKEIHASFYMVSLLKKGIVYLHAKMPNIIKEYMEDAFKKISSLKYLIANQVILEGINMPIDNIYITNTRGLNGKELTNLIGRVNRLNYVFETHNLEKLISPIHFVSTKEYAGQRGNMKKKISFLRNSSFSDEIKNPLLKKYDVENVILDNAKKRKNEKILETTDFLLQEVPEENNKYTNIKRELFENGIDLFYTDIEVAVKTIKNNIDKYTFNQNENIVDILNKIFILNSINNISDYEIKRLENTGTKNFYNNYISSLQKLPLNLRIQNFYSYFRLKANTDNYLLYVGSSYGEESRVSYNDTFQEKNNKLYIDLRLKTPIELINLAIIKIKMEDDFVSFKLMKLIRFLKEYKIITEEYFNKWIYNTNNRNIINFIKYGLSKNLITKLIKDNQIQNIYLDINGNLGTRPIFKEYLNNQSELIKFEIQKYL